MLIFHQIRPKNDIWEIYNGISSKDVFFVTFMDVVGDMSWLN